MLRTVLASAVFSLGITAAANAMSLPPPASAIESAVAKVAEGCGPGWRRGPGGRCHPDGMGRACPRGYHLGRGGRCWPN